MWFLLILLVAATTALSTTTTTTTTSRPTTESPYERTVILLHYETRPGEYIFFRGGLHSEFSGKCNQDGVLDPPCSIPIRDRKVGDGNDTKEYNAWRQGDEFLDWHGAEPGQGRYNDQPADGSPALWTTNKEGYPHHNVFNRYGDNYWLLDMDMDCRRTDNDGYFQIKAYSNLHHWERGDHWSACSGAGAQPPPRDHDKDYHHARCGYVNVFKASAACEINRFDWYPGVLG